MSAKVEHALERMKIAYEPKARSGWLWAPCPYHDDSNPSWRIRITKHRYGQHFCYSCKSGGTLIDLVMHKRGLTFQGAKEWLSNLEQIPVEPEELPETVTYEAVDNVGSTHLAPTFEAALGFQVPREVSFGPLADWPTPAREYAEGRGIAAEQVQRFSIGYAVWGRLSGRIVLMTWRLGKRQLIAGAYQARDFTEMAPKRYLFPSEKDRPNLDIMFGEHTWSENREVIVVTEGGLNALAVDRAVGCEVGALGSSFIRAAHMNKLSCFERVVILTDSDKAGDKAASDLREGLGRHTTLTRVRLPGKRDANQTPPDELCTHLRQAISV